MEERSLNETIKSVAGCARNQATGNSRHLETEVSLKNQTDKWRPVRLVLGRVRSVNYLLTERQSLMLLAGRVSRSSSSKSRLINQTKTERGYRSNYT